MGSGGNFDVENTVFVAVGRNFKESKSLLFWVLKNFAGRKISLLHVHQPLHLLALMDGKLSVSKLKQQAVKLCRELERQKLDKLLNQYLLILSQAGVQANTLWTERDNVEKGIVERIDLYGIRWLVMGAASEKQYSREMSELKSGLVAKDVSSIHGKARYVCQQAPGSCQIWFTCKGCLIYTRSASTSSNMRPILALSSPTTARETSPSQSHSANDDEEAYTFKCFDRSKSTPLLMHVLKEKALAYIPPHEPPGRIIRSSSVVLLEEGCQGQSSGNFPVKLEHAVIDAENSKRNAFQESVKHWKAEEDAMDALQQEEGCQGQSSGNFPDKLEHAVIDAENSKRNAFQESVKRWKAEEDAMDALHQAEALERSWKREATHRKEVEEVLARHRQELEEIMNQRDGCLEELQMVSDQNPVLETRIRKSRDVENELEEKIIQAVNLLITLKERRDELRADCDNAIREVNKLRRLVEKDTHNFSPEFLSPSFLEIIEATQNFDPSWKIGEGRCGSVYKGFLHHTKVAIKMLPSIGSQRDTEFKHEVEILSRVRHPNLVTLIGTCAISRSLILEYLENGSLEDCLGCQGKTPPLLWKTRIKIAIDICAALIFLHSITPPFIHGNLKLTNVLLDTNYVSKLSDGGIHRLIPGSKIGQEYMDPEFFDTGELTEYADVYSFGIVLLQLLTGRPASGVLNDAKCAVENGNMNMILDSSAGDWPVEQAKQLADLALRCCEKNPMNRPDLASDVWTAIEPMRDLCTTTSQIDSEGHLRAPSHFLCPIFQEVMKDPYIAADGFTYEADAIKGWLNSGHKTSPMTNLKLDHCNLLPNYALYYAIQEWMQQP